MAGVLLKNVCKNYSGGVCAVSDISLEVKDKEFVTLVGPSGCGKSTTLRMIAGLEGISSGEIYIDGKLANDIPPKDRDIAMVFQNYALYPHMTVYNNIAFGLKLRKTPKKEIEERVTQVAKLLDIAHLLDRKPKALSGGQRQRVSLGRAIVRNPKVFLFDEPLSNLDAKLRTHMRAEIMKLHARLGTTFIYVTHDQTEAMTMSDRIVVLQNGVIKQVDTPMNLYDKPDNSFVAGFIGSPQMNFLDGQITKDEHGISVVIKGGKIKIPDIKLKGKDFSKFIDKKVTVGIRPEHLFETDKGGKNPLCCVNGEVEISELMGSEKFLHVIFGGEVLIAKVSQHNNAKIHDNVSIYIDPDKIHIFDKITGKTIMN